MSKELRAVIKEETESPLFIVTRETEEADILFNSLNGWARVPVGLETYCSGFLSTTVAIMRPVLSHGIPKTTFMLADIPSLDEVVEGDDPESEELVQLFAETEIQSGDVKLYAPIHTVNEPHIRGVETLIAQRLARNRKTKKEFFNVFRDWPEKQYPFFRELPPETITTLILSGEAEHIPYFPLRGSKREKFQRRLAKWLQTYIYPNEHEKDWYVVNTAHEFHHAEFSARAVDNGIFHSRWEMDLYNNILGDYLEQVAVGMRRKEVEGLEALAEHDFYRMHDVINKVYFEMLKDIVEPKDLLPKLLRSAVYSGCDEVIAAIVSRTLELHLPWCDYELEHVPYNYSAVLHILPPARVIAQWEHQLLVDPSDLGNALNSLYDELLTKGGFEQIYQGFVDRFRYNELTQ